MVLSSKTVAFLLWNIFVLLTPSALGAFNAGDMAPRDTCGPVDTVPPYLKCKERLETNLGAAAPYFSISALDCIDTLFDNCTSAEAINVGMVRTSRELDHFPTNGGMFMSFVCCEIGPQYLSVWAKDAAGNESHCEMYLLIQDPWGGCEICATMNGLIQTEKGKRIEGCEVTVKGKILPIYTVKTDGDGYYSTLFNLFGSGGQEARLCPRLNRQPLNGVTTLDLALITRHILGNAPLASPYKIIAADANASGTITTFDVVALRKLILGIDDTIPGNQSWRFVDRAYVFAQPANPDAVLSANWPACLDRSDANPAHFIGIKIGDVNDSAVPNLQELASDDRNNQPPLWLDVSDAVLKTGEMIEQRLEATAPLEALQFGLAFPGLELLEITPLNVSASVEHCAIFPARDMLTIAWNTPDEQTHLPAWNLRFRARHAVRLRDILTVQDTPTPAIAYGSTTPGETLRPTLRFKNAAGAVALGCFIRPNPIQNDVKAIFELSAPSHAIFILMDAAGRVLQRHQAFFPAGQQYFDVRTSNLPAGTLFWSLTTDQSTVTGRLLKP